MLSGEWLEPRQLDAIFPDLQGAVVGEGLFRRRLGRVVIAQQQPTGLYPWSLTAGPSEARGTARNPARLARGAPGFGEVTVVPLQGPA
jgi:hypothetical protein